MTEREIRALLEKPYDREHWKQLITALFPGRDVFARPVEHAATTQQGRRQVQRMLQFGDVQLADGNQVALFEVEVMPGVDLTRNRVAVRKAIEQPVKQSGLSGALIAFVDSAQGLWRFSFYSNTLKDDGTWDTTNPKRYTYLLGRGEKCLTAARQFEALTDKAGRSILKDLLDAFSVEKVSKAFFKEYKEHYQAFVEHLTGKRMVKEKGKWVEKKTGAPSPKLATYFNGSEKDARDFCKKLMGRLVFLYFLQKKRWLGATATNYKDGEHDFVFKLFGESGGNDGFYPNVLVDLFFDTLNNGDRKEDEYRMPDGTIRKVPFLNGGLFDMDELDRKTRLLTFPPELFSKPAQAEDPDKRGFLDFLNAYNFTVHEAGPEEQTLAVDPEMLGHIFENLLEDNKDKGAFYTPKEIVHYMCQESLTQYLKNYLERHGAAVTPEGGQRESAAGPAYPESHQSPSLEDQLRRFLKDGTGAGLSRYSGLLLKALYEVKVCDPAIGSGAFPMGILHEVFQAVYHLQEFSPDEFSSTWGLAEWEPAEVKLRIIQHSIYGVDIERGAVDIARLRFWLSIIVDEPRPRTLPNLDYKIVVGDSLLGKFNGKVLEIDWELKGTTDRVKQMRALIDALHTKTELYFRDQPKAKKEKLATEVRALKIDLLSKQLELNRDRFKAHMSSVGRIGDLTKTEMVKATEQKEELAAFEETLGQLRLAKQKDKPLDYFNWQLDFPEILNPVATAIPGFDILIGNPPYIKEYTNREAFDGIKTKGYYYQGKMDLWYAFACSAIDKLRPEGVVCFIAQNNWITSAGASTLRAKVLAETEILTFTDFGDRKVFKSAGVQTMVFVLSKSIPRASYPVKYSLLTAPDISDSELVQFLDFTDRGIPARKASVVVTPAILKGRYITFDDVSEADVVAAIRNASNFRLQDAEIAQGIVPNPDIVNSRNIKRISPELIEQSKIRIGDGVFVVQRGAFDHLSPKERSYVKPCIDPSDTGRYLDVAGYRQELLYLTKTGYKGDAPSLVKHLSPYRSIMAARRENLNGRLEYYHLHWPRTEGFFSGPRILSIRKCERPSFTYTEAEMYVMMAFNVIKTKRNSPKFLTAILNSKLMEFWFRTQGKLQGSNFQIDSEPLLDAPLLRVYNPKPIEALVDGILNGKRKKQDTTALEREIDALVCKLYGLSWEQAKVVDPELALSKEEYDAIELPQEEEAPGGMVSDPGVTGLTDEGTLFGQVLDEPPPPKRAASRAPESAHSNGQAQPRLAGSAAILKFLRANTGWHGKSAILEGSGVSADGWNPTIKQLLAEGKVERQGEKKGARYRVAG